MERDGHSCFRYFMTPHIRFFKCESCDNHIAVLRGRIKLDTHLGLIGLDNEHTVNLNSLKRATICGRLVADLNCSMCNLLLGRTIVLSQDPAEEIEQGKCVFYLDVLRFWNGYAFEKALPEMELWAISRNM